MFRKPARYQGHLLSPVGRIGVFASGFGIKSVLNRSRMVMIENQGLKPFQVKNEGSHLYNGLTVVKICLGPEYYIKCSL